VRITLTEDPFEPGALLAGFCAGRSETGAVASFTGLVRGEQGGADSLELEAYPGFTEAAISEIVEAAIARFTLQDALVVHRIGPMAPGEAVVFVATAAAHRRAAFEACDQIMDYLKSRAPFWKKQHGPDGVRWIEPTVADISDATRWDEP